MNEHGDLAFVQAHHLGGGRVVNPVDDLNLQEMVARAERAALVVAPRDRAVADAARIGPLQAAARLGDRQVVSVPYPCSTTYDAPSAISLVSFGLSNW